MKKTIKNVVFVCAETLLETAYTRYKKMGSPDFLDEIIADEQKRTSKFPAMVDAALERRSFKRQMTLLLKHLTACLEFGPESAEADEIQNQMDVDGSWHKLTSIQQEELRSFSAMFNVFSEKYQLE